jgi:adenylate cyclase
MRLNLHALQRGSGIVLLAYISLHLFNHALGIWSLDLAGRGLTLAIRVWHSMPGTLLLYGSVGVHFALALRTLYNRRHWTLPLTEWVRLSAGLSLPLLLIRHAVGTRLAASLYDFEPNYERVIVSLLLSGTQGLQIALLAPGWVHGCLGLWLGLRGYAPIYRAKPVLVAVFVMLPLLSAAGFIQMKRAIIAASSSALVLDENLLRHRAGLDGWRHDLVIAYVLLIVTALVAGQLRNGFDKRVSRKATGEARR